MNQGHQAPPSHVALSFVGPINYPATKNLRNAFCNAVNSGAKELTFLISSSGGSTEEGFALYHFLRSLPLKLTTHNIGTIASIANIVFLSGAARLSCENSRFMFHDFTWTYAQETLDRDHIRERAESLNADASQFVEICKRHTSLTNADFESLQLLSKPTIIIPNRAKEMGIIQEIADAKIASGIPMFNIEF
jgi:ATP-dependent protease ClpP protease subunit